MSHLAKADQVRKADHPIEPIFLRAGRREP